MLSLETRSIAPPMPLTILPGYSVNSCNNSDISGSCYNTSSNNTSSSGSSIYNMYKYCRTASIDNYTPYKYNISIYHIHYSISIRLTIIQLARSPVADTSSAPSTVRGTWWPRIIAKLSDEEKTELPGR